MLGPRPRSHLVAASTSPDHGIFRIQDNGLAALPNNPSCHHFFPSPDVMSRSYFAVSPAVAFKRASRSNRASFGSVITILSGEPEGRMKKNLFMRCLERLTYHCCRPSLVARSCSCIQPLPALSKTPFSCILFLSEQLSLVC